MKSKIFSNKKYILSLIFLMVSLSSFSHANTIDNWSLITSGTDKWFNGIAYCPACSGGNPAFVTVGNYGEILISPDGVGWTAQTTSYGHLLGLGYVNGNFVALGKIGTILTSPDGATWTLRNQGTAHPLSHDLFGVAYGNSKYVVVGGSGTILTSSGAPTWSWTKINFVPTDNWLYSIAYKSSTVFAAVGHYDSVNFTPPYAEILSSPDGTTWTSRDSGITEHLRAIAYGSGIGKFVAVGEEGVVLSSSDGQSWSTEVPADPENYNLYGVAYGAVDGTNYFVTVGEAGTILYADENNLGSWSSPQSPTTDTTPYDLEAVAYDSVNVAFAAVGGYGTIMLDGDTVLTTDPVRIERGTEYHTTIQNAYDAAIEDDVIQIQALYFNEGALSFDDDISNKTVTLKGGYNAAYSANPTASTIVGNVTISDGTVVMDNIIIQ